MTVQLRETIQRLVVGYVNNKKRIQRGAIAVAVISLSWRLYNTFHNKSNNTDAPRRKGKKKRVSGDVDALFLARIAKLFKIIIPGVSSKEFWLLGLFSGFLVGRTALSLYVAELDGRITAALVQGQGKQFLKNIVFWML